jgi:hypothetical protein
MKRVVLESPYAGNVARHIAYAKMCVKDMLLKGEAPIASHLLFTQPGVLDDNNAEQRKLGIEAGHTWTEVADYIVVYTDFGISKGMQQGIDRALAHSVLVQYRQLSMYLLDELCTQFPD